MPGRRLLLSDKQEACIRNFLVHSIGAARHPSRSPDGPSCSPSRGGAPASFHSASRSGSRACCAKRRQVSWRHDAKCLYAEPRSSTSACLGKVGSWTLEAMDASNQVSSCECFIGAGRRDDAACGDPHHPLVATTPRADERTRDIVIQTNKLRQISGPSRRRPATSRRATPASSRQAAACRASRRA